MILRDLNQWKGILSRGKFQALTAEKRTTVLKNLNDYVEQLKQIYSSKAQTNFLDDEAEEKINEKFSNEPESNTDDIFYPITEITKKSIIKGSNEKYSGDRRHGPDRLRAHDEVARHLRKRPRSLRIHTQR